MVNQDSRLETRQGAGVRLQAGQISEVTPKQKTSPIRVYVRKKTGMSGENGRFLQETLFSYFKEGKETRVWQEEAEEFRILRTAKGKPYLAEHPDIFFSVSHTKNWWVCALTDAPVGIDIEERDRKVSPDLAKRFFHEEERQAVECCKTEEEKKGMLLSIWTKKEAYVKFLGVGLSHGLSSFSVVGNDRIRSLDFPEEVPLVGSICAEDVGLRGWQFDWMQILR